MYTRPQLKLTWKGAHDALDAAVAEAELIGVRQNICIVDEGCNLLAFARMDDARMLGIESSRSKADTAASSKTPTGRLKPDVELKLALATGGRTTNLGGGLPIVMNGQVVGGIGVGGGTTAEDIAVAKAALRAIGAQTFD